MLHVVAAERADQLVGALADVLAPPAADPFAVDLVAVHSHGIERWLSQELATRLGVGARGADGVCANVEFPFPARLVARAVAAATAVPDPDPWEPDRLVWPLLEVVEVNLGQPWLATLARHLGRQDGSRDPTRASRRFGAVRRISQLFDRYAVHRPEMLLAWRDDTDVDAGGGPLDARHRWQAALWRALRAHLAVASPPERLGAAVAALRAAPHDLGQVRHVAAFGLTALPASTVQVLCALAAHRDVHLYLLHPSGGLWRRAAPALTAGPVPRRDDDPARQLVVHPLLRSWGRDARELQVVLAAAGVTADPLALPPAAPTLLGTLQDDLRADRSPSGARADGTVTVHACTSRTRQVEVLRDAILHLLADDATLEPRDVVVMCPDVEAFAPLVRAVFAATPDAGDGTDPDAEDPGRRLRVRLADRALRQVNPVLEVAADLLDLAGARVTASEVLDLAGRAPVRRRFGFTDDDQERLADWVSGLGIRWGLDADHRDAYGLGGIAQNTWRAGLDRLLLGVAMPDVDDRVVAGTVPFDHVEGTEVHLAGKLAELVGRLHAAVVALQQPRPAAAWAADLTQVTDTLTAVDADTRWQAVQLHTLLAEVSGATTRDGVACAEPIDRAEVRALLAERLRGRPSVTNHRAGDLVVCTLVPMRSVPHRVVCLLGMDDDTDAGPVFPRRTAEDGDDLVAAAPRVGDRDPRTEDRQLLLDAVLAAGDALVVTYTGKDPRTGLDRPPCVPIAELVEVCTEMTGVDVVTRHPLRAHDPRNFAAGGTLHPRRPWRFDRAALTAARAAALPAQRAAPFLASPLPPPPDRDWTVDDLVRALQHPVKELLRARLELWLEDEELPADRMPTELDSLAAWKVGDGYLRAHLEGSDVAAWSAAARARGVLPPGRFGQQLLDGVEEEVANLLGVARGVLPGDGPGGLAPETALPVDVVLPDGGRVTGTVAVRGTTVAELQYGKVRPRQRLAQWIRLLAAQASVPDPDRTAILLGRNPMRSAKPTQRSVLTAAPDPVAELAALVAIAHAARREPLPLPCASACEYAERRTRGRSPADARAEVERAWLRAGGDGRDPWLAIVHGERPELAAVIGATGSPGAEPIVGWGAEEPTRFGRLAAAVWLPLLEREKTVDE